MEEQTRTLIVAGDDTVVAEIQQLVREMDVPRRQVIVEARLEEINVEALRELGIDWQQPLARASNMNGALPLVLGLDATELYGELEALHRNGLAKILASPKLAAVEGEPAEILIGDRLAVVLQTEDEEGRVIQTVEHVEVGIKLNLTATVDQANAITLAIDTEVSSVTDITDMGVPNVRTREMSTTVRVRDGQSLAIGGLIEEVEEEVTVGLPVLGDLPLFGRLFSRGSTDVKQTEMVIFLIPHIVYDDPEPAVVSAARPSPGDGTDSASSGAAEGSPGGTPSTEAAAQAASEPRAAQTNPARQPVGSVVPETEGVAARLASDPDDVSVVWVDVTSYIEGAFDVSFERRRHGTGALTGLYYSPETAWGAGVSWRRYGAEIAGIRPWGGIGVEYIHPESEHEPAYILSATAGIGTREAAPLRLEVFGRYSLFFGGDGPTELVLPGRNKGMSTGFRLGWEY